MTLPLHLVWLGGAVPLRSLENAHRLARLYTLESAAAAATPVEDHPYLPVLWLDRAAWERTLDARVTALDVVDAAALPPVLRRATEACLGTPAGLVRWLRLDAAQTAAPDSVFLPVLVYEDLRAELAASWRDTAAAWRLLAAMARTPAGRAFLAAQPRLPGLLQDAGAAQAGPQLADHLMALTDHARERWAAHGLLCMASDLLRLLALAWRPGAYADIGDAAALLRVLPTLRRVGAARCPFTAHCTVAVENDLIFCADRALAQAVAIGTALWSLRALEAAAARMPAPPRADAPAALTRVVLPTLDARMPPAPPLRPLYATPHADLANYVNRAYGSGHLVGDPGALDAYFSGRQAKERLIDHVGGFTGYQLFADRLAPGCRANWDACQQTFGMKDYAPQLGWKTHGFGTLERLVGHGRRLRQGHPRLHSVRRELGALAGILGLAAPVMEPLAMRVSEVHDLLHQAHFDPAQRASLTARAIERSREP